MKQKITVKSLIGNLLFVAVLLLILTRFLTVWSGTAFPLNLISANSMNPALMEGDIVAWIPADINDVKVGDVIVFKSRLHWPDEKFVVHRVHEIIDKESGRYIATKGDANEFIDQAGPHIVEPYITKENFVGKTLMIGQQPLKIPLIGNIGIWINDALQSLAQPTSTKGSLTYVGVFTPLTVSVVLLIIALFLIPEKAKTAREKIRLYVFGANTINIRRTFLLFFIIYVVFLMFIHCFAYDSQTSSLGVSEFPNDSNFQFGSISPGSTTHPRALPVTNPSILPVKGIIVGRGDLSNFVDKTTFTMGSGGYKEIPVTATAPNNTVNGSYMGNIMVYSSPIWYLLPDELIQGVFSLNTGGTVFILDFISACILTVLTVFLIVLSDYISKNYVSMKIDLSWHYAPKHFIKKATIKRLSSPKRKIKSFIRTQAWIGKINLTDIDPKKPILASLVLIPLLLLLSSELLAAVLAAILAGVIVYFVSCKVRSKIVLASVITFSVAIFYLIIKANLYLVTSEYDLIGSVSLGLGITGVYLLILSLLLVPLALISWYAAHLIRNLKEQKDPLLVLEGKCDL